MQGKTPPTFRGSDLRPVPASRCKASFELLETRTFMSVSHSVAPQKIIATNRAALAQAASTVAAPTDIAANWTVVANKGSVVVTWKNVDPTTTGYMVLRSVDGTTFTQAGKLTSVKTTSFSDATVPGNTTVYYKVQAFKATTLSPPSTTASALTALSTPYNIAAQMMANTSDGTSSVAVFWMDKDPNISGYNIFRSADGGAFTQIGQSNYTMFTDTSAGTDTVYRYAVQARSADRVSAMSAASIITTAPAIPSGLSANAGKDRKVALTWTPSDSKVTSYTLMRSGDGINFTQLAVIPGAASRTYTDTTLAAGDVAMYKLLANGPGGKSLYSNVGEARIPFPDTSTLNITSRYGTELVVTDTANNDTISIRQTGTNLLISAGGVTFTKPVAANGLFIYLRNGTDTLNLDQSVTTRVTVQAIDGSTDTINSTAPNLNLWIDNDDVTTVTSNVHRVSSFAGDVPKTFGASLPNPTDVHATVSLNLSLFGKAPIATDANQGQSGDCYFIATLASMAQSSPSVLTNSIVDMGDGTYTVQFMNGTEAQYIRINNQFPTAGFGLTNLYYANFGSGNRIWAPVLEKAYTYFRQGKNTYASINGGYFGEVYSALGVNWNTFNHATSTDAALYTMLSSKLASGQPVNFATFLSPPNLVRAHAYTLLGVSKVKGVNLYTVRNPWGCAGSKLEDRTGVASLTYAQLVANFAGGTAATT